MSEDLRDRLRRAAAWLDASPSEVVGVAVLLLGAVALSAWLWLGAGAAGPAAGGAEAPVAVPSSPDVTVHVAGAVRAPGLVVLPASSRVADAVAAAGGPTADAALDALNLARELTDGERLEVPRLGADGAEPATAAGPWREDGRLDLNAATASDLEELPGVGPVLAGRIVAWRDEHGPFTDASQLRQVSGIGERTFQSLVDLVAV